MIITEASLDEWLTEATNPVLQEGRQEGLQKGRQEEALLVAKRLQAMGMSRELIASIVDSKPRRITG